MIYQAKSTEFGEFCIYFFQNLKFGQILSENSNFGRPKSTEIPEFRPFRSGPEKNQNRNPNPCFLRPGRINECVASILFCFVIFFLPDSSNERSPSL
jgi:hypothetical protein